MSLSIEYSEFLLFYFNNPPLASRQGGTGQPVGWSKIWDESSHQPQTQCDLYAG